MVQEHSAPIYCSTSFSCSTSSSLSLSPVLDVNPPIILFLSALLTHFLHFDQLHSLLRRSRHSLHRCHRREAPDSHVREGEDAGGGGRWPRRAEEAAAERSSRADRLEWRTATDRLATSLLHIHFLYELSIEFLFVYGNGTLY